jgi:hypothetical protein
MSTELSAESELTSVGRSAELHMHLLRDIDVLEQIAVHDAFLVLDVAQVLLIESGVHHELFVSVKR